MQTLDRVPVWAWLLLGIGIAIGAWLLWRAEGAAAGSVVAPLIKRRLEHAKRLRDEADELDAGPSPVESARAEGEAAVDARWGE